MSKRSQRALSSLLLFLPSLILLARRAAKVCRCCWFPQTEPSIPPLTPLTPLTPRVCVLRLKMTCAWGFINKNKEIRGVRVLSISWVCLLCQVNSFTHTDRYLYGLSCAHWVWNSMPHVCIQSKNSSELLPLDLYQFETTIHLCHSSPDALSAAKWQ